MSDKVCADVSLYREEELQQGYSLCGDKAKVVLRSHGFSIEVKMQDKEGRARATVKVCGNEIFNTEDHVLKEPEITDVRSGVAFLNYAMAKEARASVALDGQTQGE